MSWLRRLLHTPEIRGADCRSCKTALSFAARGLKCRFTRCGTYCAGFDQRDRDRRENGYRANAHGWGGRT